MGAADKLKELEEELARTQKNKATEFHIGILKSKIASLKKAVSAPKKSGISSAGFDVKKSGDATVVFIGLPSTGKSTTLNALTGAKSKTAAYHFTTLTVVPGALDYRGAKIQLLDLPGIIAGAKEGSGRGKEVLAVARNADLILLMLDVFDPLYRPKLISELEGIGIRVDQEPPNIIITPKLRGGVNIHATVPLTHLNDRMIIGILHEQGIHNAEVMMRQDVTVDQFIDVLEGTRKYTPSLTILNKVDLVQKEFLKAIPYPFLSLSAEKNKGVEELKEAIWEKLRLIRIYTKRRNEDADSVPMMMRTGTTVGDMCDKLHRDLRKLFRYAQVWGPSAKFPGQKVGLEHVLKDGDVVCVYKR
ncbi:GTPase Obg [uncultured archaeon]|nr:GTPase Obg [uncultured archaeon]